MSDDPVHKPEDEETGPKVSPPEIPSPHGPLAAQSQGFLLTIGDIGVTPDWVVTPNGHAPVANSQWIATDMSRTDSVIPSWAIICAIIFALFCLLGLFFLLVKEQRTIGYVEVTVQSDGLFHKTQLPVFDPMHVQQIRALVSQAQSIAAQARR